LGWAGGSSTRDVWAGTRGDSVISATVAPISDTEAREGEGGGIAGSSRGERL
jgi:hypothetical protein